MKYLYITLVKYSVLLFSFDDQFFFINESDIFKTKLKTYIEVSFF